MSLFEQWRKEIAKNDPQELNEDWWNNHPMQYDWDESNFKKPGSKEFFNEIDQRFFSLIEHVAHPGWPDSVPFSALIDFRNFKGQKALEIGCGFGSTAKVIADSGVELTAIDLTQTAVDMTKKRFENEALKVPVYKMDAEKMTFPDNYFDLIWAWGVIHHSFRTEKIVDEIFRVLKPNGTFAVMIYHRNSTRYWINGLLKRGIFQLKLLTKSPAEIQLEFTDGYYARHFTRNESKKLFEKFYIEKVQTFDMADLAIPFRPFRKVMKYILGENIYWQFVKKIEARFGWALFIVGKK